MTVRESQKSDPVVDKMDQSLPITSLIAVSIFAAVFIAICIFPLAGDWLWIEGWIVVGSSKLTFCL